MITTLFAILLILAIVIGCFYIVDRAGTPYPFNFIVKGFIGLVGIYCLLEKAGMLHGLT